MEGTASLWAAHDALHGVQFLSTRGTNKQMINPGHDSQACFVLFLTLVRTFPMESGGMEKHRFGNQAN